MTDSMVEYGGLFVPRTIDLPARQATLAPEEKKGLAKLFEWEKAKEVIRPHLPKGVTYEEVYAEVSIAVSNNPELLECTPRSLINAIARAVQTGLIIGETVHLVPFNVNVGTKQNPAWEKRCQKITDYKGEIELIKGCGGAKNLNAYVVYENEIKELHGAKFSLEYGTELRIVHKPILDPRHRGAMAGAYVVAEINAWSRKTIWMHITEIDATRTKNSKKWKEGPCPPWYAKKTVVHQIAKELPKSRKVASLFAAIEVEEADEAEFADPVAA